MSSYTIRPGDTLGSIAARFHVTAGALAQANHISNPNLIYAGRTLTVPDGFSAPTPKPVSISPAPTSGSGTYTVRSGDNLSSIAARFHTNVATLSQLNGIHNPNLIYVGQHLRTPGAGATPAPAPPASAPAGTTYTVRSGDTLGAIATRFHTTAGQIASQNGISNPNLIYVGQRLKINGGSGPVSGPGPVAPPPPVANGAGVSLGQLKSIMPNLSDAKARQYLPYLNSAMNEFGITTKPRQAAFLAQLAHESGELRYFEEIASGAAYEGRSDLGNTQPGDGVRFKGRGPIQLTGRSNYRAAGNALGLNLEGNPTRAADLDVGFRTAGWFWKSRNLSSYADAGDFDTITRRINGGTNGSASRRMYWARAKAALGI